MTLRFLSPNSSKNFRVHEILVWPSIHEPWPPPAPFISQKLPTNLLIGTSPFVPSGPSWKIIRNLSMLSMSQRLLRPLNNSPQPYRPLSLPTTPSSASFSSFCRISSSRVSIKTGPIGFKPLSSRGKPMNIFVNLMERNFRKDWIDYSSCFFLGLLGSQTSHWHIRRREV